MYFLWCLTDTSFESFRYLLRQQTKKILTAQDLIVDQFSNM